VAVTTAIVVLVAATALVVSDVREMRVSMVRRVTGLADVIGANTAAAVVFGDRAAAEEVLRTLSSDATIAGACITGPDGEVFARYGEPQSGQWPGAGVEGASWERRHLDVTSAIREGGEAVGTLLLCVRTDELRGRILAAVLGTLAAVGGAVGLALLLAARFQRLVSDPIARLAAAAARVSGTGDYSVRVAKQGNDEVGLLCDGFNEMLEQIQRRDRALEFLAAIEQAGDAIVITDPSGAIEYVNPSFERITGYSRDEALGANPRILKSGRQEAAFYESLWSTISRGEVWRGHFTNRRKDGTLYEEEAIISPVRGAGDAVVKFVATKRDVTRERLLEEQMRQSQKMEAIGDLAGGIAHDLNNVLTVINGHAELLIERTKESSAPLARSASEILSSGRRAAMLVRQVLAFSRRQMLQPKVLDLNSLVDGMKDMLRSLASERVDVALSLAPDAGFIEADPSQLEHVLVDLVTNAADAMPKGGRIVIGTANAAPDDAFRQAHPDLRPGAHVVLSVADTGVGMTPEVRQRIFEPFFTTKDKSKGTGLGLAMTYGIVKQSGGEIDVQSVPGQGTTFRLYFPLAGMRSLGVARPEFAGRGNETILVVDDEVPVREFMSAVLRGLGYTVLEASDGLDALRAAGEHAGPVHLAITDLSMPAMGGGMLAERLARLRPGAQVLYISGYTSADGAPAEPSDRSVHVLARPFTADTLAQKVREVLSATPTQRTTVS
jgi:PAS domain S-box-containing protein